jgi:flagellar assembly protein FliH
MSSSPSRARIAPRAPAAAGLADDLAQEIAEEVKEVVAFPYREVALPPGPGNFARPALAVAGKNESAADATLLAQAKEAARQQAEREARTKYDAQLGGERAAIAQALLDFARERAAYYQNIEREAVQLALSIARKVLHREAQVDPLLLMGIVRVAMEQMEGATRVQLAVHPQKAAGWRTGLAEQMAGGKLVEIVEDEALAPEQCELRTSMGVAALGLEVQLKEIEQGLMDLLAARPHERGKDRE